MQLSPRRRPGASPQGLLRPASACLVTRHVARSQAAPKNLLATTPLLLPDPLFRQRPSAPDQLPILLASPTRPSVLPGPEPRGGTTAPRPATSPAPPSQGPAPARPRPRARADPRPHRGAPRAGGSPSASSGPAGRSPAGPFPQLRAPVPGLAPPAAPQAASSRRPCRTSCSAPRSRASPPPPAPRERPEPCDPPQLPTRAATAQAPNSFPRLPPSLPLQSASSGIFIIHETRPASPDRGLGLAHPARRAGAAFWAVIG